MRFTIYDILSNLIPGCIFAAFITVFYKINISNIPIIFTLAIVYALGFILNSISSWIEPILFWSWGGKPSDKLLNGKSIWKIKFYASIKVKSLLKKETDNQNASNDELFNIALRYVSIDIEKNRIYDFNAAYVFARSLFTIILILYIIGLVKYYNNYHFIISGLIATPIIWYRAKQRGYYLAKEILNNYLIVKNK